MRRAFVRTLILAPIVAAACSTSGTATTVLPVTSLEVAPEDFLGGVSCDLNGPDGAGKLRAYVATLTDVSRLHLPASKIDQGAETSRTQCYPAKECFVLPSSKLTSCATTLSFQRVVPGRQYVVDVDGYDRADLKPLAPGSRLMKDPSTGAIVPPRWQSSCGRKLSENDPGAGGTYPGTPAKEGTGNGSADGGIADAATPADASTPSALDAGPIPVLPEKPDSGNWYYECRAPEVPDGTPAWLGGPVCSFSYEAIRVRSCEPLAPTRGN